MLAQTLSVQTWRTWSVKEPSLVIERSVFSPHLPTLHLFCIDVDEVHSQLTDYFARHG